MVKQFTTAARKKAQPIQWVDFEMLEPAEVEGDPPLAIKCRFVAEPSEGQVAFLMAHQAQHMSTNEKVGALLNFFDSALDDDTQSYITTRLLDPQDKFGLEEIHVVLSYMMEWWSGRPTRSSTDSIPPPPPTGPYSNPPTPVSTS